VIAASNLLSAGVSAILWNQWRADPCFHATIGEGGIYFRNPLVGAKRRIKKRQKNPGRSRGLINRCVSSALSATLAALTSTLATLAGFRLLLSTTLTALARLLLTAAALAALASAALASAALTALASALILVHVRTPDLRHPNVNVQHGT